MPGAGVELDGAFLPLAPPASAGAAAATRTTSAMTSLSQSPPFVDRRAELSRIGACPIASTSPANDEADRLLVARADGAADRLRARPAGARPDGVRRPAEAEAAARHARPGPHRADRSGELEAAFRREAGDPPLPRGRWRRACRSSRRRRGAVRRAGGAALDRGERLRRPRARGSRSCPASAR